jgi:PncC family amidohydrolase
MIPKIDYIHSKNRDEISEFFEMTGVLKVRGLTVATAESCTGGRVAAALTARAGASDYFVGGVVAYSNEVKANVLGVSREDLERFGAVSPQVAEQMALGALRLFDTDYAVATTGIAGPGGGTPEKPVGTVWVAVCSPETITSRLFRFEGSREENMVAATGAALEMLSEAIPVSTP